MRSLLSGLGAVVGLTVWLAVPTAHAQGVGGAMAVLKGPSGQPVGTATLTQVSDGVRVVVQAQGLTPGLHGTHIHTDGQCDPPDFMSAGSHFNPTNRQHGVHNPQGTHVGDLANFASDAEGSNLSSASSGRGSLTGLARGATLGDGPTSLFKPGGTALVIHADPDDNVSDPAGSSGPRIACGVIVRSAAALPATGRGSGPAGALVSLTTGASALALGVATLVRRKRALL